MYLYMYVYMCVYMYARAAPNWRAHLVTSLASNRTRGFVDTFAPIQRRYGRSSDNEGTTTKKVCTEGRGNKMKVMAEKGASTRGKNLRKSSLLRRNVKIRPNTCQRPRAPEPPYIPRPSTGPSHVQRDVPLRAGLQGEASRRSHRIYKRGFSTSLANCSTQMLPLLNLIFSELSSSILTNNGTECHLRIDNSEGGQRFVCISHVQRSRSACSQVSTCGE